LKNKEEQIAEMKKNHDFFINKKLPDGIMPFSYNDIKTKKFNITNSSMLRILMKWA